MRPIKSASKSWAASGMPGPSSLSDACTSSSPGGPPEPVSVRTVRPSCDATSIHCLRPPVLDRCRSRCTPSSSRRRAIPVHQPEAERASRDRESSRLRSSPLARPRILSAEVITPGFLDLLIRVPSKFPSSPRRHSEFDRPRPRRRTSRDQYLSRSGSSPLISLDALPGFS